MSGIWVLNALLGVVYYDGWLMVERSGESAWLELPLQLMLKVEVSFP